MNEEQADNLIDILQNINTSLKETNDATKRLNKIKGRLANYHQFYLDNDAEKKYIQSVIDENEITSLPTRNKKKMEQ